MSGMTQRTGEICVVVQVVFTVRACTSFLIVTTLILEKFNGWLRKLIRLL
jgi:hypothetical protein